MTDMQVKFEHLRIRFTGYACRFDSLSRGEWTSAILLQASFPQKDVRCHKALSRSCHSVGAALIMTEVRSTLRAETRRSIGAPTGPALVLRDLNELLHHDLTRAELFITMFYFRFLSETRTLKYANAGHNSPLLLRSSQTACALLDADGLVLGVKRAVDFEERSIELCAGDKLLFYTDGVTEAQNRRGDFFGVDRLCEAFRAHRNLAPETLITEVLADMREFCCGRGGSADRAARR